MLQSIMKQQPNWQLNSTATDCLVQVELDLIFSWNSLEDTQTFIEYKCVTNLDHANSMLYQTNHNIHKADD